MKQGCAQRFIIAGILALTLALRAGAGMATELTENPLASVRLGESLKELYLTHGAPWITAYQNKIGYWTYSIDNDRAWLVVGVSGGMVHSVQVLAKAYQSSAENDDAGITLGDNAAKVKTFHTLPASKRVDMDKVIEIAGADGVKRFYGVSSKTGLIDRLGRTLDDETLPLLIRWYVPSGWTPDRAIPVASSGGTSVGETRYFSGLGGKNAVYSFQCSGGNIWVPIARKYTTVDGARLDEVRARCGASSYIRTFYFALTNKEPRAFDDDDYSQALLAKAGVSDPAALPALHHKRSTLGTITPQIWFTTPNGARWLNGYYDSTFAFIYDPSNPPTTITFSYATDGSAPSLLVRHRDDRTPLSARLSAYSVSW